MSIKRLVFCLLCCLCVKANDPHSLVIVEKLGLTYGIDPLTAESDEDRKAALQCFDCLTYSHPEGGFAPKAAESYTRKDKNTWIFKLKKTAKWSDGKPVTAHDFVQAWRRTIAPGSGLRIVDPIQHIKNASTIIQKKLPLESLGVKALDAYTLEVLTEEPTDYLPAVVSCVSMAPVPHHTVYRSDWSKAGQAVSNGPYVLKEHIPGYKVVFAANPHYDRPLEIQHILVRIVPESSTAFELYKTGKVDIAYTDPMDTSFLSPKFSHELKIYPTLSMAYIYFNLQSPVMQDLNVRKALAMCLDRQIYDQIFHYKGSYGVAPFNVMGMDSQRYHYEWESWSMDKRKSTAKSLVAHVKRPLTMAYPIKHQKRCEVFVNALKEIGLEVQVKVFECRSYLETIYQHPHQFDIVSGTWHADYNDAFNFLSLYSSKGHASLATRYVHPQIVEQLSKKKGGKMKNMAELERHIMLYYPMSSVAQLCMHYMVNSKVEISCDPSARFMYEISHKKA